MGAGSLSPSGLKKSMIKNVYNYIFLIREYYTEVKGVRPGSVAFIGWSI